MYLKAHFLSATRNFWLNYRHYCTNQGESCEPRRKSRFLEKSHRCRLKKRIYWSTCPLLLLNICRFFFEMQHVRGFSSYVIYMTYVRSSCSWNVTFIAAEPLDHIPKEWAVLNPRLSNSLSKISTRWRRSSDALVSLYNQTEEYFRQTGDFFLIR